MVAAPEVPLCPNEGLWGTAWCLAAATGALARDVALFALDARLEALAGGVEALKGTARQAAGAVAAAPGALVPDVVATLAGRTATALERYRVAFTGRFPEHQALLPAGNAYGSLLAALWLACAGAAILAVALSCYRMVQRRREHPEVLFFPDASGRHVARVCAEIDRTRRRVWLAMFMLTDDHLSDALLRARRRGVDVRVLLDGEQLEVLGGDGPRLAEAGVPVVRAHCAKAHMHHKFVVLDSVLLSGSFNWTRQASHANCENLCLLRDRSLVRAFADEFLALWHDFGGGGGHRGGRSATRQEERQRGRRRDRTPGASCRGGG